MAMNRIHSIVGARALVFGLVTMSVLTPAPARAHCDGLDGPVVADARAALELNDVGRVLMWVPESDEAEIRRAFDETVNVRKLGEPARELADRYFFETVVRVHRMAEGAPYTGLKPAGRDLGAAIPAADRALEMGDPEPLLRLLTGAVEEAYAPISRGRTPRDGIGSPTCPRAAGTSPSTCSSFTSWNGCTRVRRAPCTGTRPRWITRSSPPPEDAAGPAVNRRTPRPSAIPFD
jgi:hypothetical protein